MSSKQTVLRAQETVNNLLAREGASVSNFKRGAQQASGSFIGVWPQAGPGQSNFQSREQKRGSRASSSRSSS